MDIVQFSLKNKLFIYILVIFTLAYGVITYEKMGKLQDPEFTIKDALVVTPYNGASAKQVEEEISNKLEEVIQTLPFVKEITSKSSSGQSLITVSVKEQYREDQLPQIWDQLRKKIDDAQNYLPPRAGPSIVNDDFGDVYGVIYAIYGDEYSYDELKDYVDFLKKELILVDGVGKIETLGEQQRAIIIEIKKEVLSQLGITKDQITQELYLKNLIPNFGHSNVGNEYIAIRAKENINSVEDLSNIIIKGGEEKSQIFLKDIATIKDTYKEPNTRIVQYDGHNAIALGISTISGGNVVDMGEKLDRKLQQLKNKKPLGIEIATIAHQANDVQIAIESFIKNLIAAVAIVIVVLLVFMGLRSGLIIGFVLVVTILATFILMSSFGIMLERVSLGALIIALGMLVDNAIVIIDGILSRINGGDEIQEAASNTVKQTALPLLGATIIAILAFASIGTSNDSTGEYTRSLFLVILISLSLSWITAITLTPILAMKFLKTQNKTSEENTEYSSFFYTIYGSILKFAINYKYLVLLAAITSFTIALLNFQYVKKNFFPDSARATILVDYLLPQGTSIDTTKNYMTNITKDIQNIEGIKHISTTIGSGNLRFLLTYSSEHPNSSYAQMLIDIEDYKEANKLIAQIENLAQTKYPALHAFGNKFILGPNGGGRVQIKVLGDDLDKIRSYEEKIINIFKEEPSAKAIRSDWRERVKVIQPIISEEQANLNGITKDAIAQAILDTFDGRTIGTYREKTELIPIIFRSPNSEREDVKNIENILIFSPIANKMIPLSQVITSYKTLFEDDIIYKYNRQRAITIHVDPIIGLLANDVIAKVEDKINEIQLEEGYKIEWHGAYKRSQDAQGAIFETIPVFMFVMVLIVIALFNSLKKTMIIWLSVPFALIGVVLGLLLTDKPFGFMSLLGFLSLSGMLIKNSIVLIDEIVLEHETKKKPLSEAIYDSGLNRLRPVSMAALTTAFGMIPLIGDPFFSSMAVVIVFGLMVATLLTMILVPSFYAIFFKAKKID